MTTNHDLTQLPSEWLDALTLTPGVVHSLTEYDPVLAITVTRTRDSIREVLATVRSTEGNVTHPVTLSSPTIRMRDGVYPERYADRLLTEKLGISTEFTLGRMTTWQGESVVGSCDGRPVVERLTMINTHLELDVEFPVSTDSYSWIGFVPEDEYLKIVMTRDASPLGLEETPVVYGLCTLSTVRTLEATR